jgi:amino acid adenylation domain-containing protein
MKNLSASEKRTLVAQLLQEKAAGVFVLSFAQERLWLMNQLTGNHPAYNVPASVRLCGELSVDSLRMSIEDLVERHGVLRSCFLNIDGRLIQVVSPLKSIPFQEADLAGIREEDRAAEVERLLLLETLRPFDLQEGPLWRAMLVRTSAEESILLFTAHHIATDLWSIGIMMRELAALYEARQSGIPPQLRPLPIQYWDFAAWQRKWLESDHASRQLSYWKKQLADLPAICLPCDKPHPVSPTFRGESEIRTLSADVSAGLRDFSRREGCTLFMTLLAGFQVLLWRYTGQEDFPVGSPVANRNRSEIEGLIGFFVNMVVLRANLSGSDSFKDVLRRVCNCTLDAYANQDFPFAKLVEILQPNRDVSRQALFQAGFLLQNVPIPQLSIRGISISPHKFPTHTSKFDLTLGFFDDQCLEGHWEYSADLFDRATICRMADDYAFLLRVVLENPDLQLAEILLPSQVEQLGAGSSGTYLSAVQLKCLHQRFEEQANVNPGAIALKTPEQNLTYSDLNRRANQLAHVLIEHGVGPESIVGVWVERSLDLVVGILAVLKTGAAYLPLDPMYPSRRLAYVLDDSHASILIADDSLPSDLQERPGLRILRLDREWASIATRSDENPPIRAGIQNLAYMIYTSGSTGDPKGVMVTHENAARLLLTAQDLFQFGPNDVWTLFHSCAFDFSVWEIWGALANGGCLLIVPYYVSRSPLEFYGLVEREGVTVLNQTPTAFMHFIEADAELAGKLLLRFVIFGGEALELDRLRPWFDRYGDDSPQLVNMYGITETTVHVTYKRIRAADVGAVPGKRHRKTSQRLANLCLE